MRHTNDPIYDLRSDTVTRPGEAMRRAMAEALVGDDVYREDPTALELEARAAEITGKEAALFMPTGSMGNQVALATWADRGTSVLCEARAHILLYEQGAMASLSGLTPAVWITLEDGCLDPHEVERALRPAPYYRVPVGVVTVEVTHNMAGGTLPNPEKLAAIAAHARAAHVPVHMDGARLFNAATAWGVPVSEVTALADSVMFCLSKGLGAPVGSMLCGPKDFIDRALAVRKRFGGAMRQVGILAAAGLFALRHNVARLSKDHDNARKLAIGLSKVPGLSVDLERCPTNILYVDCEPEMGQRWVEHLAAQGILINALGPERLRFVTHMDVSEEEIDAVLATIQELGPPAP